MRSSLIHGDFSHLRDAFFSPVELAFDHFFDEFFSTPVLDFAKSNVNYPKMDVGFKGKEFMIQAAVPGVEPDALKVEVRPFGTGSVHIVRISGEMDEEFRFVDEKWSVKELCKRKFSRTIPLPLDVLDTSPVATLRNGILTLKWKLESKEAIKEEVKRIPIQVEEGQKKTREELEKAFADNKDQAITAKDLRDFLKSAKLSTDEDSAK